MISLDGTPYEADESEIERLRQLGNRIAEMRKVGKLDGKVLSHLRTYFRIKSIYHSNAIEGNQLNIGETRMVVEQGLTLTGKSLKDQAEAKNLSNALDYLEELATDPNRAITEADVRTIHSFVLRGIENEQAGRYRTVPVEISGSHFPPPRPEAVPNEMQGFAAWLGLASMPNKVISQTEGVLVAAIAHTWFVTIHPFVDGNGRVARLLMNLILMRYGFPIAIITKEDRVRYYDALETSQSSDLGPFLSLLEDCIEESFEEYEKAAEEQRADQEWARSIASKFDAKAKVRAENEYEIWKNAVELLAGHVRASVEGVDESARFGRVYYKDFGVIEFEKYVSLKSHESAKKTWFFRVDFIVEGKSDRYLFFFGSASYDMRSKSTVNLFISRETPPGSFHYERLDFISAPDIPAMVEIGYNIDEGQFYIRVKDGRLSIIGVEIIGRRFVQEVIERRFGG